MREEIEAAVHFVGRVIVSSHSSSVSHFSEFKSELAKILQDKFQGHWYIDLPGKGQGYRSIRIHPTEPLDPVLREAAEHSKFSVTYLHIPVELTVWVDPKDVSCRFGDLKATYCTVLKDQDNKASTIDVDELLDTAKALYTRQQHFYIPEGSSPRPDLSILAGKGELFHYNGPTSSFADSYLFPAFPMYPPWHGEGGDGSTPPPLPYPPSFSSSAVNTTPRKSGKSNGHFRKGSNGTGRGAKNHHHHHHQQPPHHHQQQQQQQQQQSNGDGTYNHNHNNNHNSTATNGSNGTWIGDRFHWVRGTRNQQQFQPSAQPPFPPKQQLPEQQQQQQQQKTVQNSEKEVK